MKIKVIDAICGAGKTSWAIQEMNDNIDKSFIYVTPYLDEVDRIIKSTNGDFKQPSNRNEFGSKVESLRKLVTRKENIVCTHELFKLCDYSLLDNIRESGYTLILDEVLNVINKIDISHHDIKMLQITNKIKINDDGLIKWISDEYDGEFRTLKFLSKNDNLFLFKDTFMFWTLHHKSFECFEEVYVLTYLFDGQIQRYYYDLHKFEYEKYSVINNNDVYELIQYDPTTDNRESIRDLITLYEDKGKSKLNSNFCKRISDNYFSSTWLDNCDSDTFDILKSNLFNFFKTNKVANKNIFWTTTKKTKLKLINKKTKSSNFVSINIRATNEYMHCTGCAYIYNRYMNPSEKDFFNHHGVEIDEETLAVSDLIQFLFRGCIRNGKPMNVYLPSSRMRNLLYKYFNYKI